MMMYRITGVNARELFTAMTAIVSPRVTMTKAIDRLRKAGYKVVAITNNWKEQKTHDRGAGIEALSPYFDHVCTLTH
jgi:FMN phosphatase YigB (HAD superfamily)